MTKGNLSTALLTTVLTFSATVASAQLSRDEVMAQLKAAQASGEFAALVGQDSGSAYLSSHVHSSESRGNVQTQVKEARAAGVLNVLIGSESGSFYLSRHQRLDTPRAEVKSDVVTASKIGTLNQPSGEDSGSFPPSTARPHTVARPAVAAS